MQQGQEIERQILIICVPESVQIYSSQSIHRLTFVYFRKISFFFADSGKMDR